MKVRGGAGIPGSYIGGSTDDSVEFRGALAIKRILV